MKPSLFISYSRRELPFVNSLVDRLEDNGYPVWCDYRNLIPGHPWNEQIAEGIRSAEVILLVISEAAMNSKYVMEEAENMRAAGKRIVLVVFEAHPLPPELRGLEWVDFRGDFDAAITALESQIEHPTPPAQPTPESGFRAPAPVWLAFALSLVVGLLSLPTAWVGITAVRLVPLPYRILKRDFDYARVEASLFLLPLAFFVTSDLVATNSDLDWLMYSLVSISILPTALLWLALRTPGMQRWGKPIASRPRFANPLVPEKTAAAPVRYYIEHAGQDRRAAATLDAALRQEGHLPQPAPQTADTLLTLISTYNSTTAVDPEAQPVLPILLDNTQEIDTRLKRIQWIDFRRGLQNLPALARLLPEPVQMLRALGIIPSGNGVVLPGIVHALVYFLTLLAVINVAGWVPYFLQLAEDIAYTPSLGETLVLFAFLMAFFLALVALTVRALVNRRGILASIPGLVLVFVTLGILLNIQLESSFFIEDMIGLDLDNDLRGLTGTIGYELYLYGGTLLAAFAAFRWRDLLHWLPASATKN